VSWRGLVERAGALAPARDRTCLDRRGCALVGYPTSCDCGPSLSQGSGWALSVTGAASPELEALDHEYESRCHQCTGDDPCVCDAFPALLSCDSGRCTATPRSCLNFGPYCAAAVYWGDKICTAFEYCTMDWAGAPSPLDGGVCPYWCMSTAQGCLCPTSHCLALPSDCHGCDCLAPPSIDCPGPGWQCVCQPGGGIVES